MTPDEATLGILGGILHSAARMSRMAAELQSEIEQLQAHLRTHPEEPVTPSDLTAVLECSRRLAILVQTHSSTVTAADQVRLHSLRWRLRTAYRVITRGRS